MPEPPSFASTPLTTSGENKSPGQKQSHVLVAASPDRSPFPSSSRSQRGEAQRLLHTALQLSLRRLPRLLHTEGQGLQPELQALDMKSNYGFS